MLNPDGRSSEQEYFYDANDYWKEDTKIDQMMTGSVSNFEKYQIYEDTYNCSGMCHPGLFYFSNPLQYGPPRETCLKKLLHNMDNHARPLAVTSIITGTVCLIMFLGHFGLYNRPLPDHLDD